MIQQFLENFLKNQQISNISFYNRNRYEIQEKISIIKNKTKQFNDFRVNRHKNLPEFNYNKDPWLVNLSNFEIPHNVQDLLRLGEKFSNPFIENKFKKKNKY